MQFFTYFILIFLITSCEHSELVERLAWLTKQELYKHPLIKYSRNSDKIIISPHIGGATIESIYGARLFMAKKVANFLSELD